MLESRASKHRLAIFASGSGTNAQALMEHFTGDAAVEIALVVCNKAGAGVIARAENAGVPVLMIERERFTRGDAYLPELQAAGITFIVLAGFLWKIPAALVAAYPGRIVNIHPALLPKYGGKGMYGAHVHGAVIAAGEPESGITIHYVDEHYDEGDIIFQAKCPVEPGDTPETLAARIHGLEHAHYPHVVEEILRRNVK
jgi:phosphoribosylglycinamide formyltransferase 1